MNYVHYKPSNWLASIYCNSYFVTIKLWLNDLDKVTQWIRLHKKQKSKMAVWGGLSNSCEKREAKSKGEKERYKHLNAEFQRIGRRDKKAFLSDQCKELEERNRMEKTRDLFKKIRDIKGIFHAKMGSVKDRNGMDLTEAEDIKKGGKNIQKNCTKKIFTMKIITMVWSLT